MLINSFFTRTLFLSIELGSQVYNEWIKIIAYNEILARYRSTLHMSSKNLYSKEVNLPRRMGVWEPVGVIGILC